MKKDLVLLLVLGVALVCSSIFYMLGLLSNQATIEKRALELNKECYNGFDIQYIVRGVKDGQQ
jgi:hypothetical protein